MKRIAKIPIIAALCGALLLSGCDNGNSVPSEIVVSGESSDVGESYFPASSCGVTLEKAVEKAVSLSPAATEIICELGFQSALVGVSSYCDYPTTLSAAKVGSTENPDINRIIGLKPDAVITLSALSEREIYALNQAGIAVLTAPVPTNMEEYSALYREISAAFYGKEQTDSEKGIAKSAQIGRDARSALEKASGEVKLGSYIYITGKLTIAGANTFENAVLSLSGENICKESGYIAREDFKVPETAPEYLIADSSLTYADITSSGILSSFLENGSKLRYVSSRCFERPTARTAEVFTEITNPETSEPTEE
ncbi:MAG: ABC transporter substrate-binding protein [Oscillospiraceae bacterium]|nr:ABC transporter substrate-binding protein [Oscillospiraceae bacterium]